MSFVASYLALFITFEYLLPDSRVIDQHDVLIRAVSILNDYQLLLQKLVAKS